MRIWAFLLAGVAILAAAALAVRHYGIDLAAVTGITQLALKQEAPQRAGGGPQRRGPSPVETAKAGASRLSDDISAIGTLLADDPDLTVRDLGMAHQPLRIVIDSHLRLPPDSRLVRTAHEVPVWVCHAKGAGVPEGLQDKGLTLIPCDTGPDGRVDIYHALQQLAAAGLTRVFCEGGGTLAASLIRAKLVDDLALYQGGKLIGGDGQASLASLGLTALADAPQLTLRSTMAIGPDAFSLWSL